MMFWGYFMYFRKTETVIQYQNKNTMMNLNPLRQMVYWKFVSYANVRSGSAFEYK